MNKNKLIYLVSIVLAIGVLTMGFTPSEKDKNKSKKLSKTNTNDNYNWISVNQCFMWIGNNGYGSHDPRTDASGFYWPGGDNATIAAIFADGLIWGAKIGREIRVNGSTYRQGLQAGKIFADGTADDPSLTKYRIFKIRKGWESLPPGPVRDAYEKDYDEWPVEDGAPWDDIDGDGIFTKGVDQPQFIGDEVLWCVSNDLDPSRSTFTYGTLPMGLEQQTTVFGFNRTGDLGDMVFKKYTLINKGSLILKDMILAYWSDTDLGNAGDDYTGCDTSLSLGYTYNGDNDDEGYYGTNPASDGYDFFQGPIVPVTDGVIDSAKFLGGWRKGYRNLPMTAFTFYINDPAYPYPDPDLGVAAGSVQFYNYMSGFLGDGQPFIDPNTGEAVHFTLAGDPVAGTGWYEGEGWPGGPLPSDMRHVMCSGPFDMAPDDTQEVVVGILITRASDRLAAVTDLKRKDIAAQIAYDLDFQLTNTPSPPELSFYTDQGEVTLYWEPNSESYDEGDPLIYGQGYSDTTYTFQGYLVWQFSDLAGSDPTLLAIYDIADDVDLITQNATVGGVPVKLPVYELPNTGTAHFYRTRSDEINGIPLVDARPYYFGVTVFGHSPNSDPSFLENPPQIFEVRPGRQAVDLVLSNNTGDSETASQVSGTGDGTVNFYVIDPLAVTGDEYEISVVGGLVEGDTSYSIINATKSDTLYSGLTAFGSDSLLDKVVFDGILASVQNTGFEKIDEIPAAIYRVKTIEESNGPGGVVLDPPVVVDGLTNSTGKWKITAGGTTHVLNWQDPPKDQGFGFVNYEIRFTGASQYYLSGHVPGFAQSIVTKNDTLAEFFGSLEPTVPFTIWDVGRTFDDPSDDYRLAIKIVDFDRAIEGRGVWDNQWTHKQDDSWEDIYAYDVRPQGFDPADLPDFSGSTSTAKTVHKFGQFVINGELPELGTVIRISSWKGLSGLVGGDKFTLTLPKSDINNLSAGAEKLDQITVFPNPYFGAHGLEQSKYARFMRFTGLPTQATIRIVSLAGVFVLKIEKNSTSPYVDWNLLNTSGLPVASGMYIAYIDMPGIGTKIMKLAVIQEAQYIDRI